MTNPAVTNRLSPECDAEALRVLAQLPAWKPATRKGQPVAVQVQLARSVRQLSHYRSGKAKGKPKYDT